MKSRNTLMLVALATIFCTTGNTQVQDQATIQFTDDGIALDESVEKQLTEIYTSLPLGRIVTLPLVDRRTIERDYEKAAYISVARAKVVERFYQSQGIKNDQITIHRYNWPWPSGDSKPTDPERFQPRAIYTVSVERTPILPLQFTHSGFDFYTDQCESRMVNNELALDIQHTDGLVLQLPENAFTAVNGYPFDIQRIQIDLCYYQSKEDFVFADITSNSGLKMLESGGMIYVSARSGDAELKLKSGVEMKCFIPQRDSLYTDMMVFTGQNQYGITNWNPSSKDQLKAQTEDEVWETLDALETSDSWDDEVYYESPFVRDMQGYVMSVSNLGWINCDRFYEIEEEAELMVNLGQPTKKVAVRMVFDNIESILPGYYWNEDGMVKFEGMPVGEPVTILAFGEIESQMVFGYQTLNLKPHETIELALQEVSVSAFKSKVRELTR